MIDKEISEVTEGVMRNVNQRQQRERKRIVTSELHNIDFTIYFDIMVLKTVALIPLLIIPLSLRMFQSEIYQLVIEHHIPRLSIRGRITLFFYGILIVYLVLYFVYIRFQPRPHIVNDRLIYKNKTYHSSELSYSHHADKKVRIYANGKKLFTVSTAYINYGSLNAWIAKCNISLRTK